MTPEENIKDLKEKGMINSEVSSEMKRAYLNYAMSVIVSRAIPAVEDGLKPVQRRILYSMNQMGVKPGTQTKKSARIVGDVMGKYHPHGDSAIYETMVRMAQDFSLRYPLIYGQGNFGSVDGDPAAAMRYCVSGDSFIITENGLEEIGKISNNEEIDIKILSKDKKFNKASKWFDSGNHDTLRITTNKGYSLIGTKNHPILIISKDKLGKPIFVWKLLEQLNQGDIAILDRREDNFWPENEVNLSSLFPIIKSKQQHQKILPNRLNEDLAFLMGALIAEGSINRNKIEFCNGNIRFIKLFEEKWKNIFPDSKLHNFEKNPSSYGKKVYWRLECHSRYIAEFFRNIGILPVKSFDKSVPSLIFKSPKRIISKFLEAYFEGDGGITFSNKMVELSCCSKSLKLIQQLQIILLRFGIDSFIRKDSYKDINKLYIRNKTNILRFYKNINFAVESKRKKLELVLLNYKKESSLTDYVPFISDFVRNISDESFIERNNFDRYNKMQENYQKVCSIILDKTQQDYSSIFEYFLTYNYLFDPIVSIKDAGIQKVYSLKVESDCHSFISNGFISHNTEARLKNSAMELLQDLEKDTVEFSPNYDNSLKEPNLLPGKLPALLLNGATGIAVGMSTNIPPHNLSEVCEAIIAYIKNPKINIEQLCEIVKGPDFPTGGNVTGDMLDLYKTGRGRLVMRGKTITETHKNKEVVIITEIPYMLNKSDLMTQIASLVQNKKLRDISDLRDESSKGKIRIVLELRKDANSKFLINALYKYTRLQDSFSANFLALHKGQPRVMGLKEMIEAYVEYRKKIITNRTKFELKKAKDRLEIVEGLLIALKHIDEVIDLIKKSKGVTEATDGLMNKYKLSKKQATAILETKLQQLTSMERDKLNKEHEELKELIKNLEKILGDMQEILKIITKEINELNKKYGDDRKTTVLKGIKEIQEKDLVQKKDVIVTITDKGYCKRMDIQTYKEQKRGGRGVIGSELATGDFAKQLLSCSTHDYLMFFTSRGRVLWLKAYDVPVADRYSKGKALVNLLGLKDEIITNVISVKNFDDYLFMATKNGIVKKISLKFFSNPRASGVKAINIPSNSDNLIGVEIVKEGQEVLLSTKKGQAIRFDSKEVRPMGRASYGVTGIKLHSGDEVVSMDILKTQAILTVTKNGFGKRTSVQDYRKISRAGKGVINLKVNEKTGNVVTTVSVNDSDNVIMTTAKGMVIRTSLANIRIMGRAAHGVRVVKLQQGDYVTDVARLQESDEFEENGKKDECNPSNIIKKEPGLVKCKLDEEEIDEECAEIEDEEEGGSEIKEED